LDRAATAAFVIIAIAAIITFTNHLVLYVFRHSATPCIAFVSGTPTVVYPVSF
jgi:hypothetical protein